jgi:DNA-binding transcriptional LysR family regulator
LEVRHLIALVAVAEEGSFAGAADRLGYTQSAVSQQIAGLERKVGLRLLDRPGGRRPVRLTDAGARLARHAERIVVSVQLADADMAALADGHAGRLRVGTYESVGIRLLPRIVRELTQAYPELEVDAIESSDEHELLELLTRGELDLSITIPPLADERFESAELERDPFCLLVPAASELATRSRVGLDELARQPMVSFRSCRCEREIEAHLAREGVRIEPIFRSDNNGVLQAHVAAGTGCALLPRLAIDETDPRVKVIDLDGQLPPRTLALVWSRDRGLTKASKRFLEAARAASGPSWAPDQRRSWS